MDSVLPLETASQELLDQLEISQKRMLTLAKRDMEFHATIKTLQEERERLHQTVTSIRKSCISWLNDMVREDPEDFIRGIIHVAEKH